MRLKWVVLAVVAVPVALVVAGYVVLASYDRDELAKIAAQQVKAATGRDLEIAGPIELSLSLTPAVSLSDVKFQNAPWGSRPEMATVKTFEIEVALLPLFSGDIEIQNILLDGLDLLMETGPDGQTNWTFDSPPAAATASPKSAGQDTQVSLPRFVEIGVRDSRVTFHDQATGNSETVSLGAADVHTKGETAEVSLDGRYGDLPFKLGGEVGALHRLFEAEDSPLSLEGTVGDARLAASGRIESLASAPKPDFQLKLDASSVAALGSGLGVDLPALAPTQVATRLQADADGNLLLNGLSAKVGSSDLAGNLVLNLNGPRPRVSGELTSALLAIQDFDRPSEGPAPSAPRGNREGGTLIPSEPLPLDALRGFDADLGLKVGVLRLAPGQEAVGVDGHVRLADGALVLDPFKAGYAGATASGTLSLDAGKKPAALATRLKIDGIDYGRLLRDYQVTSSVQGTLNAAVDVTAHGDSPHALASTLSGRLRADGGQGVINSQLLTFIGAGLETFLVPLLAGEGNTRLNCVTAQVDFAQGIGTVKTLLIDTAAFAVATTGRVDLRQETVDLRVDTAAHQANLLSLAVPFNVTGNLAHPHFTPDPTGTIVKAATIAGAFINPAAALGVLVATPVVSGDASRCTAAVKTAESAPQSGIDALRRQLGALGQVPGDALQKLEQVVPDAGRKIDEGLRKLFGQ